MGPGRKDRRGGGPFRRAGIRLEIELFECPAPSLGPALSENSLENRPRPGPRGGDEGSSPRIDEAKRQAFWRVFEFAEGPLTPAGSSRTPVRIPLRGGGGHFVTGGLGYNPNPQSRWPSLWSDRGARHSGKIWAKNLARAERQAGGPFSTGRTPARLEIELFEYPTPSLRPALSENPLENRPC